jgi:hypothetical protein
MIPRPTVFAWATGVVSKGARIIKASPAIAHEIATTAVTMTLAR